MNLQTRLALTSPCASPDTESQHRADSACQGKGSEVVPHARGRGGGGVNRQVSKLSVLCLLQAAPVARFDNSKASTTQKARGWGGSWGTSRSRVVR